MEVKLTEKYSAALQVEVNFEPYIKRLLFTVWTQLSNAHDLSKTHPLPTLVLKRNYNNWSKINGLLTCKTKNPAGSWQHQSGKQRQVESSSPSGEPYLPSEFVCFGLCQGEFRVRRVLHTQRGILWCTVETILQHNNYVIHNHTVKRECASATANQNSENASQ